MAAVLVDPVGVAQGQKQVAEQEAGQAHEPRRPECLPVPDVVAEHLGLHVGYPEDDRRSQHDGQGLEPEREEQTTAQERGDGERLG